MKWFLITLIFWQDGTVEHGLKIVDDYEQCRQEMNRTVDLARRNGAIRWRVSCDGR